MCLNGLSGGSLGFSGSCGSSYCQWHGLGNLFGLVTQGDASTEHAGSLVFDNTQLDYAQSQGLSTPPPPPVLSGGETTD